MFVFFEILCVNVPCLILKYNPNLGGFITEVKVAIGSSDIPIISSCVFMQSEILKGVPSIVL